MFRTPFFIPASRLQVLDLLLLCFICFFFFFKGAQLCNTTHLNHLFYSAIATNIGKLVDKCIKFVKFYEALSWYQIWKTRLVLVFEIRLWKIKNCCTCSKPSSLQLMCKFSWLAAEVQCDLSPFSVSVRLHTKVEHQQRLRTNALLAFLLSRILKK